MMDVQLVNDGPVTLILDSATDAPARPTAKVAVSNELKQRRKDELAAKALAKSQRIARDKSEKDERQQQQSRVNDSDVVQKEQELIAEAERKSKELAERFKLAMTEPY
ncbi:hypothetical protein JCM11491_006614 [Sporobolomyces phaffii]